MTVKTDISKVYNRLEYDFLQDTMLHMGFDHRWIGWVTECVKSVSFSILINGTPSGMIKPERRIRQGGPFSPYLFIICGEVLSHLFTQVASTKMLKGMKISATDQQLNIYYLRTMHYSFVMLIQGLVLQS